MKRLILILMMAAGSLMAADVVLRVDSGDPSLGKLTVYEQDAGTMEIKFFENGVATQVTGVVTFWYGTNGVTGGIANSVVIATAAGDESVEGAFLSSLFPIPSPMFADWVFGVKLGSKVWGDAALAVRDNPFVNSSELVAAPSVDWSLYTSYTSTSTDGPVRADGSTITAAVNGDGSITLSSVAEAETDPVWSAVSVAVTANALSGATAFGWGDHGVAGYLTSYTEVDPLSLYLDGSKAMTGDLDAGGNDITNVILVVTEGVKGDVNVSSLKLGDPAALTIGSGSDYAILMGRSNEIGDDSSYAVISGGQANNIAQHGANSDFSSIGGGYNITIASNTTYARVGGGQNNAIWLNANKSVIAGGSQNDIWGNSALSGILGGYDNDIGASYDGALPASRWGSVLGGYDNDIAYGADWAAILSGRANDIATGAHYSLIAGRRAKANHQGVFIWADSTDADIASTGQDQFIVRATGGVFIVGGALQMGSNKIQNVTELHFVPTNGSVATVEGDAYWDDDDHTLELTTDIAEATLQVGQQFWMRAKKLPATTVSKGDAVYISGASGDKPLVALADSVTNSHVVGLAAHDWASNDGWITMEGREEDLDTSSYTEGDELFVSSVAGSLTNVSQFVGQGAVATVTRSHPNAGQVFVSIVHSELEPAWGAASSGVAYLADYNVFANSNYFSRPIIVYGEIGEQIFTAYTDDGDSNQKMIVADSSGNEVFIVDIEGDVTMGDTSQASSTTLTFQENGGLSETIVFPNGGGPLEVSSDAVAGNDIVNYQTMTGYVGTAGTTNLAGLQDVADLSGVADTEALVYDAPSGLWTNGAVASAGLSWVTNSLGSTNTISVDVGANTYHLNLDPSGIIGAGSALDDLSDVDVSAPSVGEVLTYSAAGWTNAAAYVQDSWAESETVTYAATTTVLRTHGAYPWLYATGDCEITMEAGAWATNGIGIVGLTLYHTSSETITFDAASINATDAGALTLEPLTNQLFVLTKPRGETVWRIK